MRDHQVRFQGTGPAKGLRRWVEGDEDAPNCLPRISRLKTYGVSRQGVVRAEVFFYDPGDVVDPDHSRPSPAREASGSQKRKSASEDALLYRRPAR